jgi:acetyltransferase
MTQALDSVFSPRSIVVVGGSDRPGSVGAVILRNLRGGGYAGELYVVNHKRESVQDLPSHESVHALGRALDLAVIAVPAHALPSVIEDCGTVGVQSALVLTSGFAELGAEGAARQAALYECARSHHVRLIGPNSFGVIRPAARLHAFFGRTLARRGRLALVSQSGAICTAILDWADARELGFSLVASIGGAADVGFGEVLDYLALDAETDAILLYVESIEHARRFMSGLRVAARMKPVIVLNAGRAPDGSRAALSHTGALVGDAAVFDCALRRAGAVRVDTLEQLLSAAALLSRKKRSAGNRVAIVTNAGALGVMAADHVAQRALQLAEFSAPSLHALDATLPAPGSHGNPVDLGGDASPEQYATVLAAVLIDPQVDGAIVLLSPQAMTAPVAVATAVIEAARSPKPVLACFMGGVQVREARALLAQHGVPELRGPQNAIEAFSYLASFERNQRLLLQTPGPLIDSAAPDLERARAVIASALADERNLLSLLETKAVLAAFHIPTLASMSASSAEEAWTVATRVGLPVAMKIDSTDVVHKSDVGGVSLGLSTRESVLAAFAQMMQTVRARCPEARLRGVNIEPMHGKRHARELLAGVVHDPVFGPVISFGAGGMLAEILQDCSVELPPIDRGMAHDMIERTRVRRLLGDFRGMPPVDPALVESVLVRLSELACELPEVRELDINPLVVGEDGVVAVDARIVLSRRPQNAPAAPYAHVTIEPYPAHLTRTLELADGRKLNLRPIRPEDARIEQSFVRKLSLQSRYYRFHQGVSELTPRMLVRFTQLDYDREMAFIALIDTNGVEDEVGVSRYVQEPDDESCEFALVVADAWQGHGVGSGLMRALVERAREKGLRYMHGDVLAENSKMLALTRTLGFSIQRHPDEPMVNKVTLDLSCELPPQSRR